MPYGSPQHDQTLVQFLPDCKLLISFFLEHLLIKLALVNSFFAPLKYTSIFSQSFASFTSQKMPFLETWGPTL